jgi:hypothetical protein
MKRLLYTFIIICSCFTTAFAGSKERSVLEVRLNTNEPLTVIIVMAAVSP